MRIFRLFCLRYLDRLAWWGRFLVCSSVVVSTLRRPFLYSSVPGASIHESIRADRTNTKQCDKWEKSKDPSWIHGGFSRLMDGAYHEVFMADQFQSVLQPSDARQGIAAGHTEKLCSFNKKPEETCVISQDHTQLNWKSIPKFANKTLL